MRILFWCEWFHPYIGGGEVLRANLVPELDRRGFELKIITSHGSLSLPDRDEYETIPVARFPFEACLSRADPGDVLRLAHRVSEEVEEFRPDVLHLDSLGPQAFFPLRVARRPPWIVTLHWPPVAKTAEQTLTGAVLERAARVVSCSGHVAEATRSFAPGIESRLQVIRNAVPVSPRPLTSAPLNPPRLLCLGRLVACKGFDVALEAFAILRRELPDARLTLAGDGPERERLAALAEELGVAPHVDFAGWIHPDAVNELLERATLVLMPSIEEALGLVALQTGLAGRTLIASRVGGLPEVVEDGETGILVEPGSASALTVAIGDLLADPAGLQRMGRNARKHVLERFDWDAYVADYVELYGRVVEERSSRTGGGRACP